MTDMNDPAIASLKHSLRAWSICWLFEGNEVRCRTCRAVQLVSTAPFSHAENCAAAGMKADYPFADLRRALAQLPEQSRR